MPPRFPLARVALCSAILVTAVSGMLLTAGCKEPNVYQPPPPPPVTVAHPELRTVMASLEFTGVTQAIARVDIRARVEGYLNSIDFEEGTMVEEGQMLFHIDPLPFKAALDEAESALQLAIARRESSRAELKRSTAEVTNAESQLRRVEQAIRVSPGAVTQEEVDSKRTAVLTAKAAVDSANAAITSAEAEMAAAKALITKAKLDLGYTEVTSPIKGRAGRKLVDVGNLVGSGESTVLTNVVTYDPIYVFFNVNENDLLRFIREQVDKQGHVDSDEVKLNQPIRIALGTEEGYPHEGIADYSDLAVDESTGTYEIRGVIPNSQRLIPPGAFARIQVPRGKVEALLIDPRAVGRDQSGAYLLVVNSENKVERRDVELGALFDGLQAVKGNLTADDRVIVNGLQRARPGAEVAPEMAKPAETESSAAETAADEPAPSEPQE